MGDPSLQLLVSMAMLFIIVLRLPIIHYHYPSDTYCIKLRLPFMETSMSGRGCNYLLNHMSTCVCAVYIDEIREGKHYKNVPV